MERGVNGARQFITTTYEEFWARYRRLEDGSRHHYEIVQEGRPCHLYFGAPHADLWLRGWHRRRHDDWLLRREVCKGRRSSTAACHRDTMIEMRSCRADLEFRPEVNAGLDGDALVERLLADVAAAAQRNFGLSPASGDVLELDSSTPQKFSRFACNLQPSSWSKHVEPAPEALA